MNHRHDRIEIDDFKEGRSQVDLITHFDASARDRAVNRGTDFRVFEFTFGPLRLQACLVECVLDVSGTPVR